MLSILSTNDSIFPSSGEDEPAPSAGTLVEARDRPGRGPVYSVETLMEGRSACEAVFKDATPFLRR